MIARPTRPREVAAGATDVEPTAGSTDSDTIRIPRYGFLVRISELSKASGVPLPTLKFYLREGLLQPGEAIGPNQARYGDTHLRRLRFVRALRDSGGLSIASIRRVIVALEDGQSPLFDVIGDVVDAIGESSRTKPAEESLERIAAAAEVDTFLAERDLPVRPGAAARESLVDSLLAIRQSLGMAVPVETFAPYERAVRELAKEEGAMVQAFMANPGVDRMAIIEFVVLGTVLFEPVLLALRRTWNEKAASPQT